jgi:integrase
MLALGYRKGARGGSWLARLHDEDTGKRIQERLGTSDDTLDADGIAVLSFPQAQAKAREWFERKARENVGELVESGPCTVADAMRDYLDWYARERKAVDRVKYQSDAFIIPELGNIRVARLTKRRVEEWLHRIAQSPARMRTRPGEPQRYRDAGGDDEAPRRRKATANRVLVILKAALNRAVAEGKALPADPWGSVRAFREVDAARPRYLSDDEARRLVNACDPDFRPMVQAALLTGCRYGELAALRGSDFNRDSGTLHIRTSKSGKARHVVLTDEGRTFFETAAAGKARDAIMLARTDGRRWGRSHQRRPLMEACERGHVSPIAAFHALRHTYASRLVMRGVPLFVVATQLGHRDTRMVERHYGHLAPSYVAETVRAAFGLLGIVEPAEVVRLRLA